ncbi:hypothetical protein [Bacillus toyonensis]|uniref:hypothetical protein n=1 Tax=Bacillus toyonensis TaxID=155322 RepID=UPI002E217EE2|nr:hypothetical protein [Bacillus toyonensis]
MNKYKKSIFIVISILLTIIISFYTYKLLNSYSYNNKIEQLAFSVEQKNNVALSKLFDNKYSPEQIENLIKWAVENPNDFNSKINLTKSFAEYYDGAFKNKKNPFYTRKLAVKEELPLFILVKNNLEYKFELNPQTIYINSDYLNSDSTPIKVTANGKVVELEKLIHRDDLYKFSVSPNYYEINIYDSKNNLLKSKSIYAINEPSIIPNYSAPFDSNLQ